MRHVAELVALKAGKRRQLSYLPGPLAHVKQAGNVIAHAPNCFHASTNLHRQHPNSLAHQGESWDKWRTETRSPSPSRRIPGSGFGNALALVAINRIMTKS